MKAPDPEIVNVDASAVNDALERMRPGSSPGDHALVANIVQQHILLLRLFREGRSALARLRRLFGLANSEKTADVCPPANNEPTAPQADVDNGDKSAAAANANADAGAGGAAAADADDAGADDARAKGHGRIPAHAYPDAEHVDVPHEKLHAGDVCPCCARGKLFGMSEPSRIVRIFGQAPLVAVEWDSERLRCGGCGGVFTARVPEEAQGPKYDDTAAAMMALMRYGAGMPLNRFAHLQKNMQTPVPASTQWEVARDRAEDLQPVYEELVRGAADGRIVHNDDTNARILALMGDRRAELVEAGKLPNVERTGLFTTGVVAQTDDGPIALFLTGRQHAGENLADVLDDRDDALEPPVQMCDGLGRNSPKGHDVVLANCLAHGRRQFVDEVSSFPSECRHVLEELRIVFRNEAICRRAKLSADHRLAVHQHHSVPVMRRLKGWMHMQLDDKRVEPNSGLGKAIAYMLARWGPLTLFLRVAGAPLENNICERALKMAIRHRNNSLFYRSERGADVGDLYMTLIHTAQLHGVNAFEYITALLRHASDVADAPAAWLPWAFRATLTSASRRAA
jgi:transposase